MDSCRKVLFLSVWLNMVLLLGSGCTRDFVALESDELDFGPPRGKFLASFLTTSAPFSAPNDTDTGFAFYLNSDSGGQFLLVYDYEQGRIVDEAACGHETTAQLLAQISAIGLEPFDYNSEIRKAELAQREAGDELNVIMVDGATWTFRIETAEGLLVVSAFNPGADFANFSGFSEDLTNLEGVIDLLSASYGRCKISLAHRW